MGKALPLALKPCRYTGLETVCASGLASVWVMVDVGNCSSCAVVVCVSISLVISQGISYGISKGISLVQSKASLSREGSGFRFCS